LTYRIKRKGKYLCWFDYKKGYDYRRECELSGFAHIIETDNKAEAEQLAKQEDGKVVRR